MSGRALTSYREILKAADARAASLAGGPLAWLAGERVHASESWQKSGLPTRKDEAWKYTNVNALSDSEIQIAPVASPLAAEELYRRSRLDLTPAAELVFINGRFQPSLSKSAQGENGLLALSLSDALKSGDAKLRSALESAKSVFASQDHKSGETAFAALNTSVFDEAALIFVSEKSQIKNPIVLSFLQSSDAASSVSSVHPRVMAIFGRLSKADVIEQHVSIGSGLTMTNAVTDGWLQDASQVSYVRLQNEGLKNSHIGSTRFTVARDAKLESLQISLGAQLARQDLKVRLTATGADATVDGLYIVRGKQHADNHTTVEHVVADTTSAQLYKGILDDESRAVFNGRVYIAQDAQRSNSNQLNNNLLLSRKAEVDTKPELEIFADDVKAAHGATIGRLDPEHLFYLQSRAISHEQAVSMLALGFANDLVLRRSSAQTRKALTPIVSGAVQGLKTGAL